MWVHEVPWPLTSDSADMNFQEESALSEPGCAYWTLQRPDSQAAISGVEEFLPLDSSSVNEEVEEAQKTLCPVSVK